MKKIIPLFLVIILAYSCANNNKPTEATAPLAQPTEEVSKGLQLVANSDCMSCHQINEALTGPAYKAVANRYATRTGVADSLADKIIKGGAGNWGDVPMTPHPAISKEDAKAMVAYILSLKE